jgi:hypothetical protein
MSLEEKKAGASAPPPSCSSSALSRAARPSNLSRLSSNTSQRLVSLPSGREHHVDGQLTSRPPPSFCCLPRSKLRPSSPPLAPALLASLSSLDARSSLQPSTSPTATTARAGPRARATRPGSSPRASSPASSRPASSGTSSATSVRGVFLTPSSLSVSRRDC